MAVEITGVAKHSPAHKARIKSGDRLLSINGYEIKDVLDYMYYSAYDKLEIEFEHKGKRQQKIIVKSDYDDLGLEFASFLMDDKMSCRNKCVFCFIDQMPPDMRQTLYFKDDDARLSFLQGNYVTLTNMSDEDVERIIKMRLNINVSVHTTNPELRCKMMNNRFAGEKLKYLYQMAQNDLSMNCQIVLCPELNDGEELKRTLQDLESLMPNIQSVAVVPVGLTKFREGLYPLRCFTKAESAQVVAQIEEVQKRCLLKYGRRMVFASDEFYISAGLEIPAAECYEDYPQYENGVGLVRYLEDGFLAALEEYEGEPLAAEISLATGRLAYPLMTRLAEALMKKFPQIKIYVYEIINHYFGETITVAGLITACDMMSRLEGKPLGKRLILPKVMLKADEPLFLDDVTVSEVQQRLGVELAFSSNEGEELLSLMLGE